jgi:hypothetical protein
MQRIRGIYTIELGAAARDFFTPIFARPGRLHIFGDFEGVTDYETEMREAMTDFTRAYRESIAGLHYLVANKIVVMGVAIFGLQVTGTPVYSYSNRESFQNAILRAMKSGSGVKLAAQASGF